MTYSKPEILVLGDATRAIQESQLVKGADVFEQSSQRNIATPAYDLDE